jgi:hypothetical protein
MQFKYEDCELHSKDLRVGMGIGGWDMEWTWHHLPTGCKVVYQTHGSSPYSQYKMREYVKSIMELLVEPYEDPS